MDARLQEGGVMSSRVVPNKAVGRRPGKITETTRFVPLLSRPGEGKRLGFGQLRACLDYTISDGAPRHRLA